MPSMRKNEMPRMQSGCHQKARYWILTIPYQEFTPYLPSECSYIVGQMEVGESGFKHWQVLVAFKESFRLAAVKKIFGVGMHAEPSRSDAADAYVQKEETRVEGTQFQLGNKPIRRGNSTDWVKVVELAKAGKLDEIPQDIFVRNYSTLKKIWVDYLVPLAYEKKVILLYGPTHTGKSRKAWSLAGGDAQAYGKDPMTKTWDNYKGQKTCVIDEYRGSINISHLLRWFDRYPVVFDVKYSSYPMMVETFYITSNLHPKLWYPDIDKESLEALLRRLTLYYVPTPLYSDITQGEIGVENILTMDNHEQLM